MLKPVISLDTCFSVSVTVNCDVSLGWYGIAPFTPRVMALALSLATRNVAWLPLNTASLVTVSRR
jgi:hypothetical protein